MTQTQVLHDQVGKHTFIVISEGVSQQTQENELLELVKKVLHKSTFLTGTEALELMRMLQEKK